MTHSDSSSASSYPDHAGAGPMHSTSIDHPAPPPPPPRATLPPVQPPPSSRWKTPSPASGPSTELPSAVDAKNPTTQSRGANSTANLPTRHLSDPTNQSDNDATLLEPSSRSVPAWLISMIIHTVLLLILALWTTPIGQGISKVVLEFGEALEESPVDLDTFSIEASESLLDVTDADSDMEIDIDLQTDVQSLMSEEIVVEPPMEFGLGPAMTSDAKPMFSGRSGAMKRALLATYGGTDATIEAVDRGLRWLARQQDKRDGSWSMRGPYDDGSYSENKAAATSMALLAFLGDGHTHQSDTTYSDVVEKGLVFLLSQQSKRNGFLAKSARGDERAYAQAQATIVLCEAYGLTKDSELRGPAQAALDYAAWAQSSEGGWRYEPRFDSDLSVTGWFLMGLISGRSAGLEVDSSTLNQVTNYLNDIEWDDGATYGYQRGRAASRAMTAEGLLCRQYLGWPKTNTALNEGVSILIDEGPFNVRNPNVYYWYYATQVLHHFGDSPWRMWNSVMSVELPRIQVKKGRESGSWSPQGDQWGAQAGRLFTTCLSIYCLEVYYRHLPLYSISD